MKKKLFRKKQKKQDSDEILRRELSVIYTGDRLEPALKEYRKKQNRKYAVIAVLTAVCIAASSVYGIVTQREVTRISRPESGGMSEKVPLLLEAEYEGSRIKENVNLDISAAVLTDEEKRAVLKEFAESLPDRVAEICGGKRLVSEDLDLFTEDRETGIQLLWTSGYPELVSDEGRVDVTVLSGKSEKVELTADLRLDSQRTSTSFEVEVADDPAMYESSLINQVKLLEKQIAEDSEGDEIVLPSKLSNGVRLKWKTGGNSYAAVFAVLGLMLIFAAYSGRLDKAKKTKKKYREAVVAEFPDVIDKLVLLLNSGLTVFSALMRLCEEYETDFDSSAAIGAEMADIGRRVRNTNTSIIEEWKGFAVRMESADILRFCTILEDNISKGSELCSKLENESEIFMDMRRKNIQQHIRNIDSRMMIPMMVMLMSLILVTVSPVITGF